MVDPDLDYSLTEDQIKAIKGVERAIRKAEKLGVRFWDDHGNLTAYNSKIIGKPTPDRTSGIPLDESMVMRLDIKSDTGGNSDDPLFVRDD